MGCSVKRDQRMRRAELVLEAFRRVRCRKELTELSSPSTSGGPTTIRYWPGGVGI